MTTTICGHCGDRVDGVTLEDHDDECQPECFRCAESFDAKTDILWHDCPEVDDSDPPTPDRIPERERLDRRERQREADGRAERRRLGRQR